MATTVYTPDTSNWLAPAQDWFAPSTGIGGQGVGKQMNPPGLASMLAPAGAGLATSAAGNLALNGSLSGGSNLAGGSFGGFGGLAGGALGGLFTPNLGKNAGGQIGGAIGGVLGSYFGPAGAFAGTAAGKAIGSQFGAGPTVGPNATAGVDLVNGQPWGNSGDNGGNSNMLSGWLGNQIADAAARGGLSGISNIQYGNNPGNHGGPLNQFAVYMQGNPSPYVIQAGGFRQDAQGNVLDQDPNELIRGLVENGLAPQTALNGLGPRKLMMTADDYRQNMLANGFPAALNGTGIYDKGVYMPWGPGGSLGASSGGGVGGEGADSGF